MDKVELYRHVFITYKELCAQGHQPGSFRQYCKEHGVKQSLMRGVLGHEFQNIKTLPGYRSCRSAGLRKNGIAHLCHKIYEEFKTLCANNRQPGTFTDYCRQYGITRSQMHGYLRRNGLRVAGLPGFSGPAGVGLPRCKEIPFEDVIFEEAGFLPAGDGNAITVRVDGHVVVSFPADTNVSAIAKFIKKMGKEVCHVES